MAEDAGALLVRSGLIAEEQLLIARQAQAGHGGTLGEHLVLAGFIDDQTLADFYRTRLMVPQVAPRQLARIPDQLVAKIPADMATEFRCLPVALDRDQNLTVAMADPSTTHTVDEIAFFTGHYVVRAVATQGQIAWGLAHYYRMLTPLGRTLLRDPAGAAALPGPMPPRSALTDVDPDLDDALATGGPAGAQEDDRGGRAVQPADELPPRPHLLPPLASAPRRHGSDAAHSKEASSRLPLQPPEPADDEQDSSPVPVAIDEPEPLPPRPPPPVPRSAQKQQVVSFLQEDTAPTGPIRVVRRPQTNPPELTPRAGELDVPTGPVPMAEEHLPAVMVTLRRETQRILRDQRPEHVPLPLPTPDDPASEPVPDPIEPDRVDARAPTEPGPDLTQPYPSTEDHETGDETGDEAGDEAPRASSPVLLEPRGKRGSRSSRKRRYKHTRLGMGFAEEPSADPGAPEEDTESAPPVMAAEEQPTAQMDAPVPYPDDWTPPVGTQDSIHKAAEAAARAHARARSASAEAAATGDAPTEPAAPDTGPRRHDSKQAVPTYIEEEPSYEHATERYDRRSGRSMAMDHTGLEDEEWGPPGTTIPPSYLGATPDHADDAVPATIPIHTDSLDPLDHDSEAPQASGAAPDAAPGAAHDRAQRAAGPGASAHAPRTGRRERSGPVQAPLSLYDSEHVTPEVLREFEESQDELAEVLRHLQLADTRDAVIDILARHMSESHHQVAFFAVKSGRLLPWKIRVGADERNLTADDAPWLSLDRPSTFQDIVGTRLPFRGPISDRASRDFIAQIFGSVAGQMLGLPVAVRERVVGVLYGDTSKKRVFVQNLGVLARAAGGALERILKSQKGP